MISQSKPEVEFQYDGRPFSEAVSSYSSAGHWDIFTKFGTLRDPSFLSTTKPEPEVDSRRQQPQS